MLARPRRKQKTSRGRGVFATAFPRRAAYNDPHRGGEGGDRGLFGQRVPVERTDGLSAFALRRGAGRDARAAGPVPAGGAAGRRVRRGGVSARLRRAVVLGRQGCGGPGHDGCRLRRSAPVWAHGAADGGGELRFCRLRAGIGAPLRRRAYGKRNFLHGRKRPGAADRRRSGLRRVLPGVPGLGGAGHGGSADSG